MPTVTRTFDVTPSPSTVIDYLKDFSHAEAWDPGTEECTRIGAGPIAVGARFHNKSKIAGVSTELEYRLEKLTDTEIVFVGENDSATSTDTITVVPSGSGSTLTYEAVIEPKGLGKLAEPIMKLLFERIGDKTEKQLTEVLAGLPAA